MKSNSKVLSFFTVLLLVVKVSLSAGEISNCLQIVNDLCQLCDSRLAMNPTRLSCVETKIENCIFIDESENCLECSCGYVVNFSQKQCIKLPIPIEGCRQVNYQNTCIEPKQYFMITPLGVIPSNESNCKRKSNAWLTPDCVECQAGYYLRNGRCVSLSTSSQSIGNSTAAFLVYNSTTSSISINCHTNWYSYSILGSQGCARTIDHCDTYSSAVVGICDECIPGYFVASMGALCVRATVELDYCVEVNSSDLTKCIRCLNDEYKVVNGACTTRIAFVTNCVLHNPSDDSCLKCDAAHYLNASSTACTTRASVGCATVPTSTDTCLSCQSGYYFTSSTNSCTLRTYSNSNCLEYSSSTDKCAVCVKAHYVNSAGTCTARVNSVNNCITPLTSEDKCSDCYTNAVRKSDGSCVIPSYTHSNCIGVEDTTNNCTQCTSGFGIIQDTSNCADNFQNIPNCAKYTSGTTLTCEVCQNQFLLTSDKKKCLIPYGSCIQAAKPCDSFTSEGSTPEKYVCNIVNNSWIIASTITLLYSLLLLFI